MRKINKNIIITLIFMLIEVFLCGSFAYAVDTLRVPMRTEKMAGGVVGENGSQKLFLQKKVSVIAKDDREYFVEEVSPNDYAGYIDRIYKIVREEEELETIVPELAKDNLELGSKSMFWGISQDLKENGKNNNILAFFVLIDAEREIIGVSILYKPKMIPESESEDVTAGDAIRFRYQNNGLGTRLREIVFGCLVRQGNYTLAAEVTKDNEVSRNSLLKALQKLGLSVKVVPSRHCPTAIFYYIIDLSQSTRHAI